MNQIYHQLVTAPIEIREKYRDLNEDKLIATLAPADPGDSTHDRASGVARTEAPRDVMHGSARRPSAARQELDQIVTVANPGSRAAYGVEPDTASDRRHRPSGRRPAAAAASRNIILTAAANHFAVWPAVI